MWNGGDVVRFARRHISQIGQRRSQRASIRRFMVILRRSVDLTKIISVVRVSVRIPMTVVVSVMMMVLVDSAV